MTYIPDPIEQMESRIDRMADEYVEGQCMLCGDNVGEANLLPYNANPDSPAACEKCCGLSFTW